ncbi:acetylglutamate kinase [Bacteroidia bacterium]|nr:acetylglutamate kinase [Bacteroidia bacterium]
MKKENLTILKAGGNVIDYPEVLGAVLRDFAGWQSHKLLVHGGGKIASELMRKMGLEPTMVDGRRVTDKAALDIVTMVYAGLINKNIVASLQQYGCNAIGLSGADANVIPAVKRPVKEVDYGFVGDLTAANIGHERLLQFINMGLTPVMAPITHDCSGSLLNTNADTIASIVAIAMAQHYEVQLVFCFEKNGVLRNPTDDHSVIPLLDEALFQQYKAEGVITAGMLPKLENAFAALHNGVSEVRICSPAGVKQGGTSIRIQA